MATKLEVTSRWVASGAVVVSALFFGWYTLAVGTKWAAMMPFFGGFVAAWLVALLGLSRQRWWGPGYAAGLSILTVSLMAPAAARLDVLVFLGVQLTLLGALGVGVMSSRELSAPERETATRSWHHGVLAFTGGLAVPWLLAAGLLPGGGLMGLVGLAGAGIAALGLFGAFRERTWGLLAIGLAIPLLLAIPPSTWGCIRAPQDIAGEVASITLGAGLLVWVVPMIARLRAG